MSAPRVFAIIPARLGSTRFPEKVLAAATGKPLIAHVYECAKRATKLDSVVVAADNTRVVDVVLSFGGNAVLTSVNHPNGSSRLAEAARILGLADSDIIVNVQGDEPEIDPQLIDAVVLALRDGSAHVTTIASPFASGEDPANPNIVKVVRRADGLALYFSRSLIPFNRDGESLPDAPPLKHVGIYCYRNKVLQHYVEMKETPLERTEKLEQLRFLEKGYRIQVVVRESKHHGIDTPEQYEEFVQRYRSRQRSLVR